MNPAGIFISSTAFSELSIHTLIPPRTSPTVNRRNPEEGYSGNLSGVKGLKSGHGVGRPLRRFDRLVAIPMSLNRTGIPESTESWGSRRECHLLPFID